MWMLPFAGLCCWRSVFESCQLISLHSLWQLLGYSVRPPTQVKPRSTMMMLSRSESLNSTRSRDFVLMKVCTDFFFERSIVVVVSGYGVWRAPRELAAVRGTRESWVFSDAADVSRGRPSWISSRKLGRFGIESRLLRHRGRSKSRRSSSSSQIHEMCRWWKLCSSVQSPAHLSSSSSIFWSTSSSFRLPLKRIVGGENFHSLVYTTYVFQTRKRLNREVLSFTMKDYNCSCRLCSCQSMVVYYTYNQTFLGFCASSFPMWVKAHLSPEIFKINI